MNFKTKILASGLSIAMLALANMASAASVTPNFDTFGNLTTQSGGQVTFGGSGIPTSPAAVSDFIVGSDNIRVGIIATPRFSSPTPTNDGAGTYTAQTGESASGLSLWNFSFFAESSGDLANAGIKLYYDLDPTVGNDLSTLGVIDVGFFNTGSVFDGSQNLGFGYLASGAPGVTAPVPFAGAFSPFAPGEYSFRIGTDTDFAAINVNVAAVPLPAGLPLFLTAIAGLYWVRRKPA
ncbi:hypothetical protein ROLI_008780 [Roseobacter fucihabitans]|uniref:Uncharacterized protein n=1 Tax=Roseobacter fucihabitans TaxID=1537242 RepID=A0ABZ2BPD1_9RHOB|nr:VPLPA-CTERM sorting domain-containing protein [Roseobacter litoralis]MBC6967001.1 hypothetical protein [Roseobacter litoralis]